MRSRAARSAARGCLAVALALALEPLGAACARGPRVTTGANAAAPSIEPTPRSAPRWCARRSARAASRTRACSPPSVSVPRHLFVAEELRASAYEDHPLPIGHEQTISQPYIVALMTDLLQLDGDEKVLEIGTGSGYQAAVLGELADQVYTIEIVAPLAEEARARLADLGYENVHVRAGDGYRGWPEQAPFDAIILTAAPPAVPQPLIDQLAIGGILAAPVGDAAPGAGGDGEDGERARTARGDPGPVRADDR